MVMSKDLQRKIKDIIPVSGSGADRWKQYNEVLKILEPVAIRETLDTLHKAVALQLRL